MFRHKHIVCLSALCLLGLAGCAKKMAKDAEVQSASEAAPVSADESEKARGPIAEGELQAAGVEELVRTNNLFAFDLYRAARSDHFVISPHAAAQAVALTHALAGGATAEQAATTLRATVEEDELQERFLRLSNLLRSRAKPSTRDLQRGFNLLVSHGIWHAPDVSFTPELQRIATTSYFATIEPYELGSDPAIDAINKHYSDVTSSRMNTVLGQPIEDAKLVLTHTAQFDAPWALPFERVLTKSATFAAPDGALNVQMMSGRMRTSYLDGEGFELVELPYADGRVSVWVVLPDDGNEAFDGTIAPDFFEWMISSARQREVAVQLPQFEIVSSHDLGPVLKSMGMSGAFEEGGELPGATGATRLDELVQVARIKIDEDGSDALAATRGSVTSPGGELPKFVASRPFMVVVRDNPSGAVLMMARVARP